MNLITFRLLGEMYFRPHLDDQLTVVSFDERMSALAEKLGFVVHPAKAQESRCGDPKLQATPASRRNTIAASSARGTPR